MGRSSLSLVAAAALVPVVVGGGVEGPETKWFTTTCWSTAKEAPVTSYSTIYVDKPITSYSTIYVDKPTTYYQSTTLTDTVIETQLKTIPTTQTVYETITLKETEVIASGVTSTEIATVKETEVVVSGVTSTEIATVKETEVQISGVTNTEYSVATETAAVTSIRVVVTTVYETITPAAQVEPSYVTVCPTTLSSTLEGLVLCPSRTANPIPKSFPSDYTWGCRPGQICKPKQINCNFEQNLPEDGFYCEPEECIDAPYLPPWDNYEGPWTNYSCDNLLDVVPGYFYFDPHLFGLDFDIYNFGGQVAKPCETSPSPPPPPPPPPSSLPPPPPPSSSSSYIAVPIYSSSEWQAWTPPSPSPETPTPYIPLAETPVPYSSVKNTIWQPWDASSPAAVSETWGAWTKTAEVRSHVTARAVLAKRASIVPNICEVPCQQCILKAENTGKVQGALCPTESPFQRAFSACLRCIDKNKVDPPKTIPPLLRSLKQYLDICSSTTTVPIPISNQPLTMTAPETTTTVQTTMVTVTPTPESSSTKISTAVASSSSPPPPPTSEASAPSSTPPTSPSSAASSPPPQPPSSAASSPLSGSSASPIPSPAGSVTVITSCNCVISTSTLAAVGSPPVSQITDGQIQAPAGPATFTGGVSRIDTTESNWFLTLLLSVLALFHI